MARKALGAKTNQQEEKVDAKKLQNRLKKLIPLYGSNKTQLDELKTVVDGDNKEIKSICKALSVDTMEVDGWKMNYSVVTKHNVNEAKMLEIVKHWWAEKNGSKHCPYIRVEEHIDNEAIQDAIYNGEFDKETLLALRACDTEKPEEKLRISSVKEKKNG